MKIGRWNFILLVIEPKVLHFLSQQGESVDLLRIAEVLFIEDKFTDAFADTAQVGDDPTKFFNILDHVRKKFCLEEVL